VSGARRHLEPHGAAYRFTTSATAYPDILSCRVTERKSESDSMIAGSRLALLR
jgi:hypothetical protein